jgi:hypothetical protein
MMREAYRHVHGCLQVALAAHPSVRQSFLLLQQERAGIRRIALSEEEVKAVMERS